MTQPISRLPPLPDEVYADPGRHNWYFREKKPDSVARYVRADLPPKVKPLEWVQSGGTHVMDHECHTIPTGYTVRYADEDGWKWTAMGLGAYGWEPTPAMAQSAAQAHHDARILAALAQP